MEIKRLGFTKRIKDGAASILSVCPHEVLGLLCGDIFSPHKETKGAGAQNWWFTGRS